MASGPITSWEIDGETVEAVSDFILKVEVKSLSRVRLFATPCTVAYQAPQSMEFSRKSTGVGCCFLLQGIFLTKDQASPSPALAGRFFTTVPPGKSRKTTDNTEKVIDKVQRTFMSYFRFSL